MILTFANQQHERHSTDELGFLRVQRKRTMHLQERFFVCDIRSVKNGPTVRTLQIFPGEKLRKITPTEHMPTLKNEWVLHALHTDRTVDGSRELLGNSLHHRLFQLFRILLTITAYYLQLPSSVGHSVNTPTNGFTRRKWVLARPNRSVNTSTHRRQNIGITATTNDSVLASRTSSACNESPSGAKL